MSSIFTVFVVTIDLFSSSAEKYTKQFYIVFMSITITIYTSLSMLKTSISKLKSIYANMTFSLTPTFTTTTFRNVVKSITS